MKITKLVPGLCIILIGSSCEKVIDMDLNDANPNIVIEAPLVHGNGDFDIRVTMSTSYFDGVTPDPVSGALVTISDELNNTTVLADMGNGVYRAVGFLTTEDHTYSLNVVDGSNSYDAESYMPSVVTIDSLPYEFVPANTFAPGGYQVYCAYTDPAGISNYYKIRITVNGEVLDEPEEVLLLDDELSDGNDIVFPIFTQRLELGDTALVELISLDQSTHKYLEVIADLGSSTGGGEPAAPGNPETNWTNNALGYFGSYNIDSVTVVIQ